MRQLDTRHRANAQRPPPPPPPPPPPENPPPPDPPEVLAVALADHGVDERDDVAKVPMLDAKAYDEKPERLAYQSGSLPACS